MRMRSTMPAALLGLPLALSLAGCALYFGPDSAASDPSPPGGAGAPDPGVEPPPDPSTPPSPPPSTSESCGPRELHVISVYEASGDHSVTGQASVTIARPGRHVLALSAYEATSWHVTLGPNVQISEVVLAGYEAQTVDLPNVPVRHVSGCGYSYPYNGGGCDTNQLLATIEAAAGAKTTSFHGCYQASQWTLGADRHVTSNCNTAAGYEVDEVLARCDGGGGWQPGDFLTLTPPSCTGARFVRYDARYGAYVGAILCGAPSRYKLYMSRVRSDKFLEIADYAGHGQDHCELVNPAFTIPDEDDITSGGCTSCTLGDLVDIQGVPVYARATFGQEFERVTSRFWADLTTTFYSCGVALGR